MREKVKKEKELIEQLRLEENFLPYYSDTFFEACSNYITGTLIGVYAILFLIAAVCEEHINIIPVLTLMAASLVLLICLSNYFQKKMKKFGYRFYEDKITLKAWGNPREYRYEEIVKAVEKKKVILNTKAVMVPYEKGFIRFSYEICNTKQQKHVIECYEMVCKRLSCDMPEMKKSYMDSSDRVYFYQRSFYKCVIGLVVLQFLLFSINLNAQPETWFYIWCVIIAYLQLFCISRVYRSISLSKTNILQLREKFKKETNITIRIKNYGIWRFVAISFAVIIMNVLIITNSWLR